MKKPTYEQVTSGDWFDYYDPRDKALYVACCHCSLVHRINARIYKGRLQLQFIVEDRRTAQLRRWDKQRKAKK